MGATCPLPIWEASRATRATKVLWESWVQYTLLRNELPIREASRATRARFQLPIREASRATRAGFQLPI